MDQDNFEPSGLLKGNNKLTICAATMNAVLADWLSREMMSRVEVVECKQDASNDYAFVIKFKEPTP